MMDKRIFKLQREIAARQAQILVIQEQCEHVGATKIAKSDTGGWDRNSDRYWYKCYCGECGKSWTEDQ